MTRVEFDTTIDDLVLAATIELRYREDLEQLLMVGGSCFSTQLATLLEQTRSTTQDRVRAMHEQKLVRVDLIGKSHFVSIMPVAAKHLLGLSELPREYYYSQSGPTRNHIERAAYVADYYEATNHRLVPISAYRAAFERHQERYLAAAQSRLAAAIRATEAMLPWQHAAKSYQHQLIAFQAAVREMVDQVDVGFDYDQKTITGEIRRLEAEQATKRLRKNLHADRIEALEQALQQLNNRRERVRIEHEMLLSSMAENLASAVRLPSDPPLPGLPDLLSLDYLPDGAAQLKNRYVRPGDESPYSPPITELRHLYVILPHEDVPPAEWPGTHPDIPWNFAVIDSRRNRAWYQHLLLHLAFFAAGKNSRGVLPRKPTVKPVFNLVVLCGSPGRERAVLRDFDEILELNDKRVKEQRDYVFATVDRNTARWGDRRHYWGLRAWEAINLDTDRLFENALARLPKARRAR